jgi:DNA adenine methylase
MYNSKNKTPISYYGGKQSMLKHLLPYCNVAHRSYTETFFGGGALFFAKDQVANEVINDKWDVCVNFYKVLKLSYRPLNRLIQASLISRTQHNEALQVLRNPGKHSKVKMAWAFWYCSNWSFSCKIGGGMKFSNMQNSVVPVQLRNKKRLFTEQLVARLENASIENKDAIAVLQSANVPWALHYIDTPYFNADMGHYSGFTENNLVDVLECCQQLTGKFVLSNYNSEPLEHYITKNNWFKKEVTHRIKAPRKTGTAKVEVIVSNYNPADFVQPKLF